MVLGAQLLGWGRDVGGCQGKMQVRTQLDALGWVSAGAMVSGPAEPANGLWGPPVTGVLWGRTAALLATEARVPGPVPSPGTQNTGLVSFLTWRWL